MVAEPERGTSRPASRIARWKPLRSSAMWMASSEAPMSRTPSRSSSPDSASATLTFSPVCPPSVGKIASGFSRSSTDSTDAGVRGSM